MGRRDAVRGAQPARQSDGACRQGRPLSQSGSHRPLAQRVRRVSRPPHRRVPRLDARQDRYGEPVATGPPQSRSKLRRPRRTGSRIAARLPLHSRRVDRPGARCRAPRRQAPIRRIGRNRRKLMRSAVIVSTARTPIGRAYRGAFNDTQAQALAGHVVAEAVRRAGVDPAEVEDVVLGAALQQGSSGFNLARQAAVRGGLPVSVAGMTVDRQCASGLMAIATAAKQIVDAGMEIAVGGGAESISLVKNDHRNQYRAQDLWLLDQRPDLYMTMIETAEIVAERYQVTRDAQDEYALQSQQRTAAGQAAGRFDREIAPLPTIMRVE